MASAQREYAKTEAEKKRISAHEQLILFVMTCTSFEPLGLCFFSVEGRLIADRKVHGSGNEAELVDLLMQRGCEF